MKQYTRRIYQKKQLCQAVKKGGEVSVKKRILALFLCICMIVTLIPEKTVIPEKTLASADGKNAYGHTVMYSPVRYLYTTKESPETGNQDGLMPLRLFDANLTEWTKKNSNTSFLKNNNYVLNKFLKFEDRQEHEFLQHTYAYRNARGKDPDFTSGYFSPAASSMSFVSVAYNTLGLTWWDPIDTDPSSFANYDNSRIYARMNDPSTGNIGNMLKKGDIQYHLSYNIYLQKYARWFTQYGSEMMTLYGFGGRRYWADDKNTHHNVRCDKHGIPNLGNEKEWYPAIELSKNVVFKGAGNADMCLNNGMLIGRDIAGPKMYKIKVTSDIEGTKELEGPLSLDDVNNKLTDRTIYFQLTWDEPVKFNVDKNADFQEWLSKLKLTITCVGKDDTDPPEVAAPFIRFAPKKYESTPTMTFEYKIPAYYHEGTKTPAEDELGPRYQFDKICISQNKNPELWKHLTDLSGNLVSTTKGNQKDSTLWFNKEEGVDLEPLAITDIEIIRNHKWNEDCIFLNNEELYTVRLKFNKYLDYSVLQNSLKDEYDNFFYGRGEKWKNLPTMTMSLKNGNGENISIVPEDPHNPSIGYWYARYREYSYGGPQMNYYLTSVSIDDCSKGDKWIYDETTYNKIYYYDVNTISFNMVLKKDMSLNVGDFVHPLSLISPDGLIDKAGNRLMNYHFDTKRNLMVPDSGELPLEIENLESERKKYDIAIDKQYKYDVTPPQVTVKIKDAGETTQGEKVICVEADVQDQNLDGQDASFTVTLGGNLTETVQVQASASESYDNNVWRAFDKDEGKISNIISMGSTIPEGGGKAYSFLKISPNSEIDSVKASVNVSDEAGNTTTADSELSVLAGNWTGFDQAKPIVTVEKEDESLNVSITDMNDITYKYAWTDSLAQEPDWNSLAGDPMGNAGIGTDKQFTINAPKDIPDNINTTYPKKLWIRAEDSYGNVSDIISMNITLSRTFADISFQPDPANEFHVETKIDNVQYAYYTWMEKPANYIGKDNVDYGDASAYLQANPDMFEMLINHAAYMEVEDIDPDAIGSQNSEMINQTLTPDTMVISVANDGETAGYGETEINKWNGQFKRAGDSHRPLMLVVAVKRNETIPGETGINEQYMIKEYDAGLRFNAPEVKMVQYRFSTNDRNGKRQDSIRIKNGERMEGLFWPGDTDEQSSTVKEINYPNLYGIAESEFYLAGDPVTGFEGIDMENSSLEFVKVNEKSYSQDTTVTSIQSWKLSDLVMTPLSNGSVDDYRKSRGLIAGETVSHYASPVKGFVVSMDPAIIDQTFTEPGEDEQGVINSQFVTYEFRVTFNYKEGFKGINGGGGTAETITKWVFNNNSSQGYVSGVLQDGSELIGHYEKEPVKAVFDSTGNNITTDIPLYTFSIKDASKGTTILPDFILGTVDEYSYNAMRVVESAGINTEESMKHNMGVKGMVRWGTDPSMKQNVSAIPVNSYDISTLISGAPLDFANDGDEYTIYYQIYDEVKKTESPVYVMKLRRDDTAPTLDLYVSETREMVKEVKVKPVSLIDAHMGTTGLVEDSPANKLLVEYEAWRDLMPGEDFPQDMYVGDKSEDFYYAPLDTFDEGRKMVRVRPDEDGYYNFINTGFLEIDIWDQANNHVERARINGEDTALTPPVPDFHAGSWYEITNIDNLAPELTEGIRCTENQDNGSFTLTAKTDKTAERVMIGFDQSYGEFVMGSPSIDNELFFYDITQVPGSETASYDPVTGQINLTAFVRYIEENAVPLTSVIVRLEDHAGNQKDTVYTLTQPLHGVKPKILNPTEKENVTNVDHYPIYTYGEELQFNVPVILPEYSKKMAAAHGELPIYKDGVFQVDYVDLFGTMYTSDVYADIFGKAYAHQLIFKSGGKEISPTTPVNQDVTVSIDTSKNPGLHVEGNDTIVLKENGYITYSLKRDDIPDPRQIKLPVNNIDKTSPTAFIKIDMEQDEKTNKIYSVQYTITHFSESDVEMIPDANGNSSVSVQFDSTSPDRSYTFHFRDRAGNEGTYEANVEQITFADHADQIVTSYRAYYSKTGENVKSLWIQNPDNLQPSPETYPVNGDVSVMIEGLNSAGEVVPTDMSVNGTPSEGINVFPSQKNVVFSGEASADRAIDITLTDTTGNTINVPLSLKGDSIDKTMPKGTVEIETQSDGNQKIYLRLLCDDVPEERITVEGNLEDGTKLKLQKDAKGLYTIFDNNGSGRFLIMDHAGNLGTVGFAVVNMDKEPPKLVTEGWTGVYETEDPVKIKELLTLPTNNSIFVFFSFDEQIGNVSTAAFDENANPESETSFNPDAVPLQPTEEYVTVTASGNVMTVEFKKNCQAKIEVEDLRGNKTVIWRPDFGPISVIDKELPKLEPGYPIRQLNENTVTYTYKFTNGEEVKLLEEQAADNEYKNEHVITFRSNHQNILTFADRAGNVFTDYPLIQEIDETAPKVIFGVEPAGEGKDAVGYTQISQEDLVGPAYQDPYFYTTKNVRIYMRAEDETMDGLSFTAVSLSGAALTSTGEIKGNPVDVVMEENTIETKDGPKTFTHYMTAEENGIYQVTVQDKWGNKNTFRQAVSMIDREAPKIRMDSTSTLQYRLTTDPSLVEDKKTELENELLKGVKVHDKQSGKGMIRTGTEEIKGLTVTTDITQVDFMTEGLYPVIISAEDALGNRVEKKRMVSVRDARWFKVNGNMIAEGDVFYTGLGTDISIDVTDPSFSGEKITLYYAEGYKTLAQMKYGHLMKEKFSADKKGYYTIMAQSAERGMYLMYVYVFN